MEVIHAASRDGGEGAIGADVTPSSNDSVSSVMFNTTVWQELHRSYSFRPPLPPPAHPMPFSRFLEQMEGEGKSDNGAEKVLNHFSFLQKTKPSEPCCSVV